MKNLWSVSAAIVLLAACSKKSSVNPPAPQTFSYTSLSIGGLPVTGNTFYNVSVSATIQITFSAAVNKTTVQSHFYISNIGGEPEPAVYSYPNDTTVLLQPSPALQTIASYLLNVTSGLESQQGDSIKNTAKISLVTALDTTNKFPLISDSALLTLVEQQTFNYFWNGADANSGMAKERASQTEVTTGGSGFGVMSMLVAVQRGFITRAQALTRISTIVNFLTNSATTYHGAFSHWINGETGATIPFSTDDNGGDIVETSYMIQGLLCARQYFNSTTDPNEISLRTAINTIYNNVDWNWYRQNGQNVLYWNWSPNYNFAINVRVQGWCEAMIAYILGASSPNDTAAIPPVVYTAGWAQNGAEKNGNAYYGITLPLGPSYGGPLFFAHYSFLGINPNGLSDAYANYWTQNTAHATINYSYCVANPGHFNGYDSSCWGLTASDDGQQGYLAHSPTSDNGTVSPTAAISSLPYSPTQSMNALRFFYYKLGNKIWGQYGFIDAFNLTDIWFDNDYLAIDQGPEIVMIENYRSGLLWNLFMSCPEIQAGMTNLGFQSPNL
ncbi:MAG TPA: glucoamylase family protein [Puia sp.]|jgi:hypothetical protein|nr:glucoamylase family protein [Puia sp.]